MSRIRKIFVIILFLLVPTFLYAGLMGRPRKIRLIKTEYFDILFPEESLRTAYFLADKLDLMLENACEQYKAKNPFKITLIISPDSDFLSVKYTQFPFNRIIVYEAVAKETQSFYQDALLALVSKEIKKAALQNIRGEIAEKIYQKTHIDFLQPVSLFNFPSSFIEGAIFLDWEEESQFAYDDAYFLEQLMLAKLENKFPKWIQLWDLEDVYPIDNINIAAGAGFAAFLQYVYGYELYSRLWQESGKFSVFKTEEKTFFNVYGFSLQDAWQQFYQSIPTPQFEKYPEKDFSNKVYFEDDQEGLYTNIVKTNYGLVWYDALRHEVSALPFEVKQNMRQLLFYANNVENITVSPDGNFIVVSYQKKKTLGDFVTYLSKIYDLRNRTFVPGDFEGKDASIIVMEDGSYGLCCINTSKKKSCLEVYEAGELNTVVERKRDISAKAKKNKLIFSVEFNEDCQIYNPVFAGKGQILFTLHKNAKSFLCLAKLYGSDNMHIAKQWQFEGNFYNFNYCYSLESEKKEFFYTFEFYNSQLFENKNTITEYSVNTEDGNTNLNRETSYESFSKFALLRLTETNSISSIQFLQDNIPGGVKWPFACENEIYFARYFSDHSNIIKSNFNYFEMVNLPNRFVEQNNASMGILSSEAAKNDSLVNSDMQNQVLEYTLFHYNPFKYLFKTKLFPFLPILDLDFNDGAILWPGLGFTYATNMDPLENTKLKFSVSGAYLQVQSEARKDEHVGFGISNSKIINTDSANPEKISMALMMENSSTPVDIKLGSLWNFSEEGQYSLRFLFGGQYEFPFSALDGTMIIRSESNLRFSTEYYDQAKKEYSYGNLENWVSLSDSYSSYEIAQLFEFSNINSYGLSAFEKRGIKFGFRFFAFWDLYTLNKNWQEIQKNKDSQHGKSKFIYFMQNRTQMNVNLYMQLAIPRLLPFSINNSWLYNLPTEFNLDLFRKPGELIKFNTQILLLGREVHNGSSRFKIYCSRFGMNLGFNFTLDYDTNTVSLPDIKNYNLMANAFHESSPNYSFYVSLVGDFVPCYGILSSNHLNGVLKFEMFPNRKLLNITIGLYTKV